MKKLCSILLAFICFHSFSTAQVIRVFYNKKFEKVDNADNARYAAVMSHPDSMAKIVRLGFGNLYAQGVIMPANTLRFDGKVSYFDDNKQVRLIKYFENGREATPIPVDENLKENTNNTTFNGKLFMQVDRNGEFTVFRRYIIDINGEREWLHATGKVSNVRDLTLEGRVTFFDNDLNVNDIRIFKNGKEKQFLATTADFKESYEILDIVTLETATGESIEDVQKKFYIKCKLTGADGVVGIKTSITLSETEHIFRRVVLIQGTAIKFKNGVDSE